MGRQHTQTACHVDAFFHVDTPLDIALCRRLIRDQDGLSKEEIIEDLQNYLNKTRKLFLMEDAKSTADYVLDGTLPIKDLVEGVCEKLSRL